MVYKKDFQRPHSALERDRPRSFRLTRLPLFYEEHWFYD